MGQRVVVLERDAFAHGHRGNTWIFAGLDAGRSVRISVRDADWRRIKARAGGYESGLGELERMAAHATRTLEDGFGGYFVDLTAGGVSH
jgi:hypothetical protein